MNKRIQKLIKNRKKLYWEAGGTRTADWKVEKKRVEGIIRDRKRGYIANQKAHLLNEDASRNFYKHVIFFSKFEKPAQFDIRAHLKKNQMRLFLKN